VYNIVVVLNYANCGGIMENKLRINISVSPELLETLDEKCAELCCSRSAFISLAIQEKLCMSQVMSDVSSSLNFLRQFVEEFYSDSSSLSTKKED
jgi:metal-responsive CopG/Arc/MetJ family transcriptional regulator